MPKQSAVERAATAAERFGDSVDVVDQAAAALFGINRTDLRLLGVVTVGGPQSAGTLAAAVGLSPAATTEAVQRLVARGLLARDTDPGDRRRAVITVVAGCAERLDRVYGPIRDSGVALLERYTEAELGVIADFLERGREQQLAEAARIRDDVAGLRAAVPRPGC
ncbi:MarR family winged helix-turn-helix transcriptional regulator [Pseudonocardia sp. GCM10023141]|uniref:MarR family winged helix-turn-helix transcriptional regulator n=1 Tax=Pseudonocardia sp. GCM10023141 TaxID=3252653 RepID=UPI00360DB03E